MEIGRTITAFELFNEYRKRRFLSDIVVVCDGKGFPAHSIIMAVCSVYFRDLFLEQNQDAGRITLTGLNPVAVSCCMKYIYTGEVHVTIESAWFCLEAAAYLGISGMSDKICKSLIENISPKNCLVIKDMAEKYDSVFASEAAERYILQNFESILDCKNFGSLLKLRDVIKYLKSDEIVISSKDVLWKAVLTWVNWDIKTRKDFFFELLNAIHIEHFPVDYLHNTVWQEPLAKESAACVNLLLQAMMGKSYLNGDARLAIINKTDNCISAYDAFSRIWEEVVQLPTHCYEKKLHQITYTDNCIYLLSERSLYRYDVRKSSHSWTYLNDMIIDQRTISNFLACGGYLVVIGQRNSFHPVASVINPCGGKRNNEVEPLLSKTIVSVGEVFDIETGKWSILGPNESWGKQQAVTADGHNLFFMGGLHILDDSTEHRRSRKLVPSTSNLVQKLNLATNTLSRLRPLKIRRFQASAAYYQGTIYVAGGTGENGVSLNSVEMCNEFVNGWTLLPNMSYARPHCSLTVVDGTLYVVGCSQQTELIEKLDHNDSSWSSLPVPFEHIDNVSFSVVKKWKTCFSGTGCSQSQATKLKQENNGKIYGRKDAITNSSSLCESQGNLEEHRIQKLKRRVVVTDTLDDLKTMFPRITRQQNLRPDGNLE